MPYIKFFLTFQLVITIFISGCNSNPTYNVPGLNDSSGNPNINKASTSGYQNSGLTFDEYHSKKGLELRKEYARLYDLISYDIKKQGYLSEENKDVLKRNPQVVEYAINKFSEKSLSTYFKAQYNSIFAPMVYGQYLDFIQMQIEEIARVEIMSNGTKNTHLQNLDNVLEENRLILGPHISAYNYMLDVEKEVDTYSSTLIKVQEKLPTIKNTLEETVSERNLLSESLNGQLSNTERSSVQQRMNELSMDIKQLQFWLSASDYKTYMDKVKNDPRFQKQTMRVKYEGQEKYLSNPGNKSTLLGEVLSGLANSLKQYNNNTRNTMNSLQSTYKTPSSSGGVKKSPTYYNRIGDYIVGSDGTSCTGIGDSVVCR